MERSLSELSIAALFRWTILDNAHEESIPILYADAML